MDALLIFKIFLIFINFLTVISLATIFKTNYSSLRTNIPMSNLVESERFGYKFRFLFTSFSFVQLIISLICMGMFGTNLGTVILTITSILGFLVAYFDEMRFSKFHKLLVAIACLLTPIGGLIIAYGNILIPLLYSILCLLMILIPTIAFIKYRTIYGRFTIIYMLLICFWNTILLL